MGFNSGFKGLRTQLHEFKEKVPKKFWYRYVYICVNASQKDLYRPDF